MFSLVIDTSTEKGCMAFFDGHDVLFMGHLPMGLNNSKYLLPEIERGFKFLGKKAQDLDFVGVGIGPGSYTGIRVGVMVAKALVFAIQKPLITFCSLKAFIPSQEGPFAAILDAKIGGVYILKSTTDLPQLISLNELQSSLSEIQILATPQMGVLRKKIEDLYPNSLWLWEEKDPDMLFLCKMIATKYERGEFTDEKRVDILYLRKTQAEIEKDRASN